MKEHVEKLYALSRKPSRRIIGLMSGTSLDGLDVALCRAEGSGPETHLSVEHFKTVPYEEDFRNAVREIFAKRQIDFQQLVLLNPFIGLQHGRMILECLVEWGVNTSEVDLIASHGQTVFHAPQKQHGIAGFPNATLQIGDGDHIAVTTGIITLSDFRQKHIAAGGEGAPLAVYGDYFLFSQKNENRILLNMGGIANFTFLPGNLDASRVFTTDTGPGNTLIDAFARLHFGKPFDENGRIAASGAVDEALLNALKDSSFFEQPFPKTTGPEVFSVDYVQNAMQLSGRNAVKPEDLIATLTQFSAETISEAIRNSMRSGETNAKQNAEVSEVYASGGGAHNPALMDAIGRLLGQNIRLIDELGVAGDAKEAVLFAVLANEAVAGEAVYFGEKKGVPGVSMGKISFPG
ncbi:anhydro-N-acetylmuramic acid kinase [Dyadobacter sp. BE34]|uniref:Anhydro-N-acetylmuramic acid kinase n=1 Tax=Dyadobacter fermentans TaxID=94254 RepID=A0ABU1R317_9BACT|nr:MULTISPECIES: anhydro-N-acetylmuramic acid kinase [Dyadobacter]MDR6807781.1 anhydro-N-acetylmuramic acid kinase [Dyadobacter fermentans]MDR7045522.1 anhydro-N-acetylmuramic acid kinase [Dyadobacter sp. BE242]MDR7199835.1 anhydro-N-acetylmuramic acid kinase [Dyadobacter sp. BE34]MDR7217706.1 anhydro-N-acetylmuramic acid kinase [Dyadobacter sp. BE31]MDR7265726.1 anhydro-N-acetylmuramic acid kinase [Dyadobacter sp. BE32]